MVPVSSVRISRVPTYSGSCLLASDFIYGSFTLFPLPFQVIRLSSTIRFAVRTPFVFLQTVWAFPISLATTLGITFVFFSFGYLDVSVPRVPLHNLLIQLWIMHDYMHGVPSFGYPRITRYLLFPVAFRSLSRPSSAPCTKAFSVSPL